MEAASQSNPTCVCWRPRPPDLPRTAPPCSGQCSNHCPARRDRCLQSRRTRSCPAHHRSRRRRCRLSCPCGESRNGRGVAQVPTQEFLQLILGQSAAALVHTQAVLAAAKFNKWDSSRGLAAPTLAVGQPVARNAHPGDAHRAERLQELAVHAEVHRAAVGKAHGKEPLAVDAEVGGHPCQDCTRELRVIGVVVHAPVPGQFQPSEPPVAEVPSG